MNQCACGCGVLVKWKYKRGHGLRIKNPMSIPELREARKGKKNPFYGKQHNDTTLKIISDKVKSCHVSKSESRESWINNISNGNKGKIVTIETREKIRRSLSGRIRLDLRGENNGCWKGGKKEENSLIRDRSETKTWRKAVFQRDDWTCQKCGARGSIYLQSHHIKNFAEYPELRFEISNGITFCRKDHYRFHKFMGRKGNSLGQVKMFIGAEI